MAKNWAIVIGINHYDHLQSLDYAGQDAQCMNAFLQQELAFDQIFLFTDDSPPFKGKSTRPTRSNLIKVLLEVFAQPFMGDGDNFWFFFSGHGIPHNGRDYLMPADGYPGDVASTAIEVSYISDRLKRCGADNVVMILDACRKSATRAGEGIGRQAAATARQTGIISIFSCSPDQYSYEIPALQQGAFTYALLEGLGIRGQCATVERLNQYLTHRVPELVRQYNHDDQTPYTIIEPLTKAHLILNRRHATLAEIAILKNDAYQAELNRDVTLAEQLWIRVLAAAAGQDMDAIRAFKRLAQSQATSPPPATVPPPAMASKAVAPPAVPTSPPIAPSPPPENRFSFEVVTVNDTGTIIQRQPQTAAYHQEDLGNGITLDMVQIPGGSFDMGTSQEDIQQLKKQYNTDWFDREHPQHPVTIPDFFMGKYPVTQAQYQAIMDKNPSHFKGDNRPVERVSWHDAVAFCQRLSEKTGKDYRLPSEAEWEYACRAGTTTPFYVGPTITPDLVNYNGNYPYGKAAKGQYREQTTEVGSFPPNAFGLYDMHGNVLEWCADTWHDRYNGAPADGSTWVDNENQSRVLRGGSWDYDAGDCRSANRNGYDPDFSLYAIGFRLVLR